MVGGVSVTEVGGLVVQLGGCDGDAARLGGKGASLTRLVALGFRVPAGLVVTAHAFDLTIDRLGLRGQLDVLSAAVAAGDNRADAAKLAAEVRAGPVPREIAEPVRALAADLDLWSGGSVIVRSSATAEDAAAHSFAGMFESIVARDPDMLEATILEVWASAFAPRAIAYLVESGVGRVPPMAVVVQRFLDASRSGVMFTRFTAPDGTDRLLVEHVEGGCEKLVKGEVTPDRLWLDRGDGTAVPAEGAVLRGEDVAELARVAHRLEDVFGAPQDVEWVIEGGAVHVVQSRPITASGLTQGPVLAPTGAAPVLTGTAAGPGAAAGAVHLAFNIEQAMALERGAVLVTPMTNPDMVVAMRRSAAVVTDVGGVICHAAIVSRELGLPCVVGTEHATTTLHDGQAVTVDGTGGQVFDGSLPLVAASATRTIGWRDLWDLWVATPSPSASMPVTPCIDALAAAPASVRRVAIHPDLDLRDDGRGLWRDVEALPLPVQARVYGDVAARIADVAHRLDLDLVALDPLDVSTTPAWRAALDAIGDERVVLVDDLDPTVLRSELASAAAPTRPAATGPASLAVEAAVDTRRFFGHEPARRRGPMPPPEWRARWWRLLPEYGRCHAAAGTAGSTGEHDWLEVRPELVISPLLKSLVQPGFEMVPPALGFPGIGPMHVKWIRCRYHFRADSFARTWEAIVRSTWDRAWLADVLGRVRASYAQLEEVLALFPTTGEGLRASTPAQLVALVTSWWPRWVEFFALNWFLQAQGDDIAYPFLAETVADSLARLPDPPPGRAWPQATDLVAPTTSVMSGDYMAAVAHLRAVLLSHDRDDPAVLGAVADHIAAWGWMRDRDLLFEPWDTPERVIDVALATEAHAAPPYEENRAKGMVVLGFHLGLAAESGRAEALARLGRFLHDLNVERENHHVLWLKYSYPLRRVIVEVERRLAEAGGFETGLVFFLQAPELLAATAALPAPIDPAVASRARNRRAGFLSEAKLAGGGEAFDDEDDYL